MAILARDTQRLPKHSTCLDQSIPPFKQMRRFLGTFIIGEDPRREVDDLEPSPRAE